MLFFFSSIVCLGRDKTLRIAERHAALIPKRRTVVEYVICVLPAKWLAVSFASFAVNGVSFNISFGLGRVHISTSTSKAMFFVNVRCTHFKSMENG